MATFNHGKKCMGHNLTFDRRSKMNCWIFVVTFVLLFHVGHGLDVCSWSVISGNEIGAGTNSVPEAGCRMKKWIHVKAVVTIGCSTDISKYVKTTADHDYCYSAVFENNQKENGGSNIGWKKYGVPKIKGVRRDRNEGSQNGKEEDVNYNFIWSAIGDSNVIGGSGGGGMEGVEEEVNGDRQTCQWKPMNRLENGAGLIATTTCSDVLRDLFDDICFMGMLTTLSTRQRNWICRMMSEEGCQFIKGECSVLKDL